MDGERKRIFSTPCLTLSPLFYLSVLYGALAVRSFDWAEANGADDGANPRPATLVADTVLTPSSAPALLRPAGGGNIHAFACSDPLHPTAVLDLLAPPYSGAEGGRDCTYFAEEAAGGGGNGAPPTSSWPRPDPVRPAVPGTRVLLHAVPAPPGFKVEHGPYRGRPAEPRAGGGAVSAPAPAPTRRRAREGE